MLSSESHEALKVHSALTSRGDPEVWPGHLVLMKGQFFWPVFQSPFLLVAVFLLTVFFSPSLSVSDVLSFLFQQSFNYPGAILRCG